ncbi:MULTISPECIES: type VII secretion protein EccB [unclassified Nocardioides]|uniref:type VII secretion protein EccB n=1 Tax=unclassified Nocardioides TaxID=2615069 RepID=UPI0006F3B34E|nr:MULTISPECIES: type VII secretion protein EccB [unclassified Nocardioides]KRA29896.1 hypothetical protein ASD81_19485 [Nocardioides sp. Root614]KRA86817.1 hypothetical protein ASD84_21700 [Nocardioides sp. Root682]
MATKKDLVEAYSFSRRRLVTAFVSGAPGGREVEPARPGRMIVGGVALAVLLIAGAAVAGALTDRPPADWDTPGLVTDDHGALYVILEEDAVPGQPRLRQIINVTSAQLILGADVKTKSVPEDELNARQKGSPIGILDAPATVPAAGQLINSGWISCTATGKGIKTEVTDRPGVELEPDLGFVVRAAGSGKRYLIAEATVDGRPRRAYSYELPADNDGLDIAIGVSPNDEIAVPDEWLALFPVGGALTASGLAIPDLGAPVGVAGYPSGTRVGDLVSRSGDWYAVSKQGLIELSDFAEAVLRNTQLPGAGRPPAETESANTEVADGPRPYAAAAWPDAVLSDSAGASDQICGQLVTEEDEQPRVLLATAPSDSGMLDGVANGGREVNVMSGRGALIRSAEWTTSRGGTTFLIDDRGRTNSVAGALEVEKLGYKNVPAVVVPDSWNKLFQPGADLSRLAALCPPTTNAPSQADEDKNTCS